MANKKEYSCVLVETDEEGITWVTFNLCGSIPRSLLR